MFTNSQIKRIITWKLKMAIDSESTYIKVKWGILSLYIHHKCTNQHAIVKYLLEFQRKIRSLNDEKWAIYQLTFIQSGFSLIKSMTKRYIYFKALVGEQSQIISTWTNMQFIKLKKNKKSIMLRHFLNSISYYKWTARGLGSCRE